MRFKDYINKTGIKEAFSIILAEIVENNVPRENFYKYAQQRLREISKQYTEFIVHGKVEIEDTKPKGKLNNEIKKK